MQQIIKCENCRRNFIPSSPDVLFCSEKCKEESQNLDKTIFGFLGLPETKDELLRLLEKTRRNSSS